MEFPGGSVVKNASANAGDTTDSEFSPWVEKIPWRRKWQPIPVFLPGKFHGQRSLAGYSPWGHRAYTTEHTRIYTYIRLSKDLKSRPCRISALHNKPSENLKGVVCQCHKESKVDKAS